jgi:hypothetical protein
MWSERLAPSYFSKDLELLLRYEPVPRSSAPRNSVCVSGVPSLEREQVCWSIILPVVFSIRPQVFGRADLERHSAF